MSVSGLSAAPRQETTVLRVVRGTRQSRWIKELHDYKWQMCGLRLERLAAPDAEPRTSARSAHRTTDTADNLLCLCPNHYVLLDHSGVVTDEDL